LCPAPVQQAAEDEYTIPGHWAFNGLSRLTWDRERGILPAFADLNAAGNVGFKKALLSCLASTSCVICQAYQMSTLRDLPSIPNVDSTALQCNATDTLWAVFLTIWGMSAGNDCGRYPDFARPNLQILLHQASRKGCPRLGLQEQGKRGFFHTAVAHDADSLQQA